MKYIGTVKGTVTFQERLPPRRVIGPIVRTLELDDDSFIRTLLQDRHNAGDTIPKGLIEEYCIE